MTFYDLSVDEVPSYESKDRNYECYHYAVMFSKTNVPSFPFKCNEKDELCIFTQRQQKENDID